MTLAYPRWPIATLLINSSIMEKSVNELRGYFCPFGYLDVQAVCKIWNELKLNEWELFDIIDDTRESFGYEDFKSIDPVACILDHALQMSRNKIEEVTGYDFINDYLGSGEIYTYGNYMCSSYDYCDEAVSELKEKVSPYYSDLIQDKFCFYFLTELGIGE